VLSIANSDEDAEKQMRATENKKLKNYSFGEVVEN
jgi:hypothetical protein